jgi:DNA-binding beta-propeller fold protein YncE
VSVADTQSGALISTTTVEGNAANPYTQQVLADASIGRTFILIQPSDLAATGPAGRGLIAVFDARKGQLLHTVRGGQGISAAALDERTQHLFVTNQLDGTVSIYDARRL